MADPGSSPIIVYGTPRSGTTYLTQIMNEHPDVWVTNETRVFCWAHESLNVLTQDPWSIYLEKDEFLDVLRASYPDLIRAFYRRLRPERQHWGDKNPHYAAPGKGYLETIVGLFPQARFVHIIRDGRDVVMSLLRKGWVSWDDAHRWWAGYVHTGRTFGDQVPKAQYFELRYEDLIRDDVALAEELFDFLGIGIVRKVVTFCKRQQEERTPVNEPTRDLTRSEGLTDWKRLLTPAQRLASLEMLEGGLIACGYETAASLAEKRADLGSGESPEPEPVLDAVRTSMPPDARVIIAGKVTEYMRLISEVDRVWHLSHAGNHQPTEDRPASSEQAIEHLESLRSGGPADFLLLTAATFGWLEELGAFKTHLDRYRLVTQSDDCLVYGL